MAESDIKSDGVPGELTAIWPALQEQYRFIEKIKSGQNASAFKIAALKSNGVKGERFFCLKIAKEDSDQAVTERRRDNLSKEIRILHPLNHVCLPRIYAFDLNPVYPWYICNFHPGITFHDFAIQQKTFDLQSSIFTISTLLDVVEYIHSHGRTHCDLHSKNILISEHVLREGLLVIDFGSGHHATDQSPYTENRGMPQVKPLDGPGYGEVLNREDNEAYFRQLDLRALGLLFWDAKECFFNDGSPAQITAFSLFCKKLQDDSLNSYEETRDEVAKVFDPLRKFSLLNRLFEGSNGLHSIRIPCTAGVDVGDKILELINTLAFQKLRKLRQLSFCDWYYPGATHTRFEHSLGVMDCVRQAINYVGRNKIFRDRYTVDQLRGAIICGLLHDVGHYPFAHVLEHYAASRFGDNREINQFVSHTTHTKHILLNDAEIRRTCEAIGGQNILDNTISVMEGKMGALSDLLDGPIDCDKLDYLTRDSHHCGLNYGKGIDKQEFLKRLRCIGNCEKLGVDRAGVAGVEGFMILQDQMLSGVYWHELTRGIICMFHAAVAHIVKTNKDDFRILVSRIRECASEQDALDRVIIPLAKELAASDAKAGETVMHLLGMHLSPNFSAIYRPIASYRHSDPTPENQLQTVYQKLAPRQTFTESNVAPVNWKNIGALRKCYISAFDKYAIKGLDREVLIDVPIGKAASRVISVLLPDATVSDITNESHLSETIFTQPAIFASPVRVYIAPELYRKVSHKLKEIILIAENEFLAMKDLEQKKSETDASVGQHLLSFEKAANKK